MEKQSTKNNILFKLIKSLFVGFAALFVAFYFVYSIGGNPYHEYLLMTKGTTTTGFITNTEEDITDDYNGSAHFNYYYHYIFNTANGRQLDSHGECDGRLPSELSDLTEPYPTDVVYLENNPEINMVKNTLCKNVAEFLWRRVGMGTLLLLIFSSLGIVIIRNAINTYLTESKNQLSDLHEPRHHP